MRRELRVNFGIIAYELQYKNVKNINLRVNRDGTINVSANKRVSCNIIDEFVASKAVFIQKAINELDRINQLQQTPYYTIEELRSIILNMCNDKYPYYKKYCDGYPVIKFKEMKSRWGSCNPSRCVLTFNTNLIYAPLECIEYVVLHEFTHFIQQNHSKKFYDELAKTCPDWKNRRKALKNIII